MLASKLRLRIGRTKLTNLISEHGVGHKLGGKKSQWVVYAEPLHELLQSMCL